ncbi:MAG TPA: energy-coupling factor transporter ATPase [Firmicutes bacterium]|nr:energy-coupling factor transporter ATPase [Bacillota bacterium]
MIIAGKGISFSYEYDGSGILALHDIDISVRQGEFVAILGCNGSGKSTLVKHLNALLSIQRGTLYVANIDVSNREEVWRLRRICGMVFQNPDNQFVSSVVEEDIAFGLENYEVPREEIPARVSDALRLVNMAGWEKRSPHMLSGGQKQRVALAGVLALDPAIVVFDEATAMLDPEGRREVLEIIRQLHAMGKTILMITHYAEEAVYADTVVLMHNGKVAACGAPREILTNLELMMQVQMIPPAPVRLYHDLKEAGIELAYCPLTTEEFVDAICRLK